MATWQTPAQRYNVRRRRRYGRFMSTPRAIGLVLMVVGVCAYGTAPDWLALLVVCSGWRQRYLQIGAISDLRSLDGISAS